MGILCWRGGRISVGLISGRRRRCCSDWGWEEYKGREMREEEVENRIME